MKIGLSTIFMFVTLALAGLGTAYGLWTKTLTVSGTVNTGNVNAGFLAGTANSYTDDDGTVNTPHTLDGGGNVTALGKDDVTGATIGLPPPAGLKDDDSGETKGDGNDCTTGGCSSADPSGPGPNAPRTLQDVAVCTAVVNQTPTGLILEVEILKAYPTYWCTVFYVVSNTGSVPVKLKRNELTSATFAVDLNDDGDTLDANETGSWTPATGSGINDGPIYIRISELVAKTVTPSQIGTLATTSNPSTFVDASDTVMGNLEMRMEVQSVDGATYAFVLELEWAQWNSVSP